MLWQVDNIVLHDPSFVKALKAVMRATKRPIILSCNGRGRLPVRPHPAWPGMCNARVTAACLPELLPSSLPVPRAVMRRQDVPTAELSVLLQVLHGLL